MLIPTIGIEVHVELKSNAKVFSLSKNAYDINANTNVNVIDLGYPGTLPKLNKEVVHKALLASLAFHCKINQTMHFDRKNYFYPDLPKGYQITQNETPIGYDGYVPIEMNHEMKNIGLERIHIEEDTCKSMHTGRGTLLDFNRAGVPLIEIVSKPEIKTPGEAVAYLESLRETLLFLGISDVKIEEGSMRCDANISLHEEGTPFGTKVEIKNIGSITNVGLSLNYEIERQTKILKEGGTILEETRRFDDKTGSTISMRVKETGNDYRYFPEPDLPYITVSDEWIEAVQKEMPILPHALRRVYRTLGINENNEKTLLHHYELCMWFERVRTLCDPVIAANLLTGEVMSYVNKNKLTLKDIQLTEEDFILLVNACKDGKISSKQCKELLSTLLTSGGDIEQLLQASSQDEIRDSKELIEMIIRVIRDNPESVTDYKAGKDRAIKFLMGQIMKISQGKANPKLVNDLLLEELKKV